MFDPKVKITIWLESKLLEGVDGFIAPHVKGSEKEHIRSLIINGAVEGFLVKANSIVVEIQEEETNDI